MSARLGCYFACFVEHKLAPGETVTLLNAQGREDIRLQMAVNQLGGVWAARPESDEDAFSLLDRLGRVPLPPYIRKGEMVESDREHYQTVYARHPGSVGRPRWPPPGRAAPRPPRRRDRRSRSRHPWRPRGWSSR